MLDQEDGNRPARLFANLAGDFCRRYHDIFALSEIRLSADGIRKEEAYKFFKKVKPGNMECVCWASVLQ